MITIFRSKAPNRRHQNLRGHVWTRACTKCLAPMHARHPKVTELGIHIDFINQHVLRFDVAVHNVVSVEEGNGVRLQ